MTIDSRTTKQGDLFIALKGDAHDGHDHVGAAFAAGAVSAIVVRPTNAPTHAPLILVGDTFTALQELGQAGRKRSIGKILAVTGSVGKTGTKEMLRLMLNEVGSTYANEGSFNNHWGVPLSLARLPTEALYGVFEIGMNHAGELGPLSQQVRPDVALITTIEAVHLEFFPSVEAIADAKAEIFQGMNAHGTVILNRNNSQFGRLAAAAKSAGVKKILGFGHDSKADIRMLECVEREGGSDIKADILGKKISYRLNIPGMHLAMNSLGALGMIAAAGADINACAAALAHYKQPKGRGVMKTIALPDGEITLIDESYNASPVAVRFAVRVLGQMQGNRKILILGDMKELGETSPTLHADLAKDIVESGITSVYCCGAMMKHLFDALPSELRGAHTDTSAELAKRMADVARSGDIITVKGSKSMRMDLVVDALRMVEIGSLEYQKAAI